MITFNNADYNVGAIAYDCRLVNMVTRHRYHVYGLACDGANPPILIRSGTHVSQERVATVGRLFANNRVETVAKKFKKPRTGHKVTIGLRRDIRDQVAWCSAALQTLIYHLEGRMALSEADLKTKLPGIPKTRAPRKL